MYLNVIFLIVMGYRGGAPSWVYRNQLSSQAYNYEHRISMLERRIKDLEAENAALKEKIRVLESQV
jgi:cell division protein FtsB